MLYGYRAGSCNPRIKEVNVRGRRGLDPDLEAPDPQVVGLYLAASASEPPAPGQKPNAVSTIERRLSAIAWTCAQRGQPLDRADRHIAEVMRGIRRRHGRPPDQKEAVLAEDLMRMVETLDHGLRGLRDCAILLIGFAGGLRRSDISNAWRKPPGTTPAAPRPPPPSAPTPPTGATTPPGAGAGV
jgi:hypothetical protein